MKVLYSMLSKGRPMEIYKGTLKYIKNLDPLVFVEQQDIEAYKVTNPGTRRNSLDKRKAARGEV